ncbi:hypothetical protein [Streptomyces sp. NPDC101150]|uniref:hypothetical protein n=1 Tax=Streptomyces sp. NPDC101150 TaxID=3366114 RepID=UPI0038158022
MSRVIRTVAVTAALAGAVLVPSAAASAATPGPDTAAATVQFAGGSANGLTMAPEAPKGTKAVLEANPSAAAAAANVCGSGYTISVSAARYGSYGTVYTWTNGKTSGPNAYYDKPICGVFFNDTGAARYMGIRLNDNYTATPAVEDFGTYSTYAGPVYQNRGYCGTVYSYMKQPNGTVVVDNKLGVGACN